MSGALLAALFAFTALLYAMVGFGGGSVYNSLLVLAGYDYRVIPIIALCCNLVVVSGGLVYFGRAGFLKPGVIMPFLVSSVPAAYVGGAIPITEQWFIAILGTSLLISGLLLLKPAPKPGILELTSGQRWGFGLPVGVGLGVLAGITGIGGGVFLAPLMYLSGWAPTRVISASASLFIFVNSIAGLFGHLGKFSQQQALSELTSYAVLPLVVLIGGQIGSYFGAGPLNERIVRNMTGLLVLFVGIRILYRALA